MTFYRKLVDGVAHATETGTVLLCGTPLPPMTFMAGSFAPEAPDACRRCVALAAAAPPRWTVAERLRDEIAGAEPAHLREELSAALLAGAPVNPWTHGATSARARHSARLHEALEGLAEAEAALQSSSPVGVAMVRTESHTFVAIIPETGRPAVVRSSPRRRARPLTPGWSFESAREPAVFTAASSADRVFHAYDGTGTLCGLPEEALEVYLHHYGPGPCPRCDELVAAAPKRPSAQERLHHLIASAEPGPLRDDLSAALTQGTEITLWLGTLGPSLAKSARLDELTENVPAVAAALSRNEHVSLADVLYGNWRSIVVFLDGDPPLIARGPTL
ncbi:MAG TPA: hypothetical protein VL738_22790 [Dactylosporangium sp.]|nr:hypothetical protein [Dactylosporangium sp.]